MQRSVAEILAAVSGEIDHLARLSTILQDQLAQRGYEAGEVEALQSLDSLHQTLDCLAGFTAALASSAGCRCDIDMETALQSVCMTALADRLQGVREAVEPGECKVELF